MAAKVPTFKNNLLFDYLKNILQLKSKEMYDHHTDQYDFNTSFPRYMIIRYLSMCQAKEVRSFILDHQVEFERFPDNRLFYKYLLKNVPRQSSSFITYLKETKKEKTDNEG